jgi:hypothetical protein
MPEPIVDAGVDQIQERLLQSEWAADLTSPILPHISPPRLPFSCNGLAISYGPVLIGLYLKVAQITP